MTYDEDAARVLGLERSNRELTESVRQLAMGLTDVADLRRQQATTRKVFGAVTVGTVALLLLSAVVVSLFLLNRVNDLIDERRASVRTACIARNQERDDLRERFATLAMRGPGDTKVWTELTKAYAPSDAVDCDRI